MIPPPQAPRILVPGTVLLDIYEDTGMTFLGGAEFNYACHLHHLGAAIEFIARVGKDQVGQRILEELTSRRFPIHGIQTDERKPSKTVRVRRNDKNEPFYMIQSDVASEYLVNPEIEDAALADYALIYFGTTLQHGTQSRDTLRALLRRFQGWKFCDLNLRPGKYTPEIVDFSLHACDILKINHEELGVISQLAGITGDEPTRLLRVSRDYNIPTICLTKAHEGSMLLHQGLLHRKHLAPCSVIDTVGAGDGFSACITLGLLCRWPPQAILDFASDFAAAICQIQGAVPANPSFYDPFLRSRL